MPMPTPPWYHSTSPRDDHGMGLSSSSSPSFLVVGGAQDSLVYAGPTPLDTAEQFFPNEGVWETETVESMPSARYAAAKGYGLTLEINGSTRAYVISGAVDASDVLTPDVEVFDLL